MVENREDLANAIALNSTMVHAARTLGPAAAGFLVYYVGEGYCFLIDAISYIAVVASLLLMHVEPVAPKARTRSVVEELREGIAYVWTSVPIRVLLLLMALLSLTGMPAFSILMPIFADALAPGAGRGSQTLGILQGASGVGALAGAIYLASRRSVVGLGRVIALAGLLFGASIIAFAGVGLGGLLWAAIALTPLVGFGMITVFASANTLLQTLADDDKRGRVMSLFTVAFMGMAPFGNLLAGAMAAHFTKAGGGPIAGAARTVAFAGALVLVAIAFFAAMLPVIRKITRPIYIQKGILPEVATGLEAADAEQG
jgi:MFS family permease